MPVDTNSDIWENAQRLDPLKTQIRELLMSNREKAYSIKEIDEYLFEEHREILPPGLLADNNDNGATAARHALISNILERCYWRSEVSFRIIADQDEAKPGIYYTWDGPGINPIAEIDDVKDPNPDSVHMTLASRFNEIEKEFDSEISELDDRVDFIEFRIHEELGAY